MTSSTLLLVLIALVLVARVLYQQSTWQPVDPDALLRMPAVLGVIGLVSLVGAGVVPTGADLGVLTVEAAVAVATGAAMGAVATFRPLSDAGRQRLATRRRGTDRAAAVTVESRTGGRGVLLWLVVLVVRVGLGVVSHAQGLEVASATGTVFLALALNRVARALVLRSRLERRAPVLS
jgi:hypothetical protein